MPRSNLVLVGPAVLLAALFFVGSCGDTSETTTGGGPGAPCDAAQPCAPGYECSPAGVCVPNSGGGGSGGADGGSGGLITTSGTAGAGGSSTCPDGRPPCSGSCCESNEICDAGACVQAADCANHTECQNDSYCHTGQCLPYGTPPLGDFNPECTQLSIAGLFQPGIQCEWIAPPPGDPYPGHVRVLSAPMVVDFDFDGDPSTITPSIVVMTYNGNDGSSGFYNGAYGVIRVIDGATCALQYNVGSSLNGCNSPAIADLDLDGRPEIIAHSGYGQLLAYRYDSAQDAFVSHCAGPLSWGAQITAWAAPSVYDLDDDAYPEIISGGIVYDAGCNVLDSSLGLTGVTYSWGAGYPVIGDVDGQPDANGDPTAELVTGAAAYRFDKTTKHWTTVWSGGPNLGYVALADFGTFTSDPLMDDRLTLDGVAEVVSVLSPYVRIMTWEGRVIYGPVPMPSGGGGGPPTVGDFDGDGLPEVSCSGSDSIAVFDPDCRGLPDMNLCGTLRTDGLLWWQPSQDHSSNITGSSLFDFEGDGRVEVIYADEVFTRVYDGQTGDVIFSQWHSSCTWNEYPIVADVDGDFNAELVVPSNSNCSITPSSASGLTYPTSPNGYPMDPLFKGLRCEVGADCLSGQCSAGFCRCTADTDCTSTGTGSGFVCAPPVSGTPGTGSTCRAEWRGAYDGIRVYADVLDRWVASRTLWSQHTYSVTHIAEDGTVVPLSQWVQNWLEPDMNHFRQNVQGATNASSSPDMTSGNGAQVECTPGGAASLTVQVCNRGTQPVGQGVPVAFYDGPPSSGQLICVAVTSGIIVPGECEAISCLWDSPPSQDSPAEVTVVADDDGTGQGHNTECVEGNNTATIAGVFCQIIR